MKYYLNWAIDLDNLGQWTEAERTLAMFKRFAPDAIVDPGRIMCHKCCRCMDHHRREYWEDPNPRWKIDCPTGENDFGGFIDHTRNR